MSLRGAWRRRPNCSRHILPPSSTIFTTKSAATLTLVKSSPADRRKSTVGVITALSSFAKLAVPNRTSFPVEQCVREALDSNLLPDTIQLTLDCPVSLPQALADSDQVRIVFANLIRNAREAMPEGGQLTVTARAVDGVIETAVADSGVGIPAEQLSRVMEPLYSTKARGLGLGLSIARAILEKNGGSLRVASEPGRGSTFTVYLQTDRKEKGSS